MRVTQKQHERIIDFVSRGRASSRPELEQARQTLYGAARAARSGHFREAEDLIASLPVDGPLGPATLDLKAKLYAQQGRLGEAQSCWMEAVRQSPGSESYRQSLQHVTRLLGLSRFPTIIYLVALALIVLLVALGIRLGGGHG